VSECEWVSTFNEVSEWESVSDPRTGGWERIT
jgi:hypothetical protein